jgi:hypothetical protein
MAVIFGLMAYPHERSIETMTTFMEEDGLDGDLLGMWAYRQLSALPSNEVAPRAETFRARAREQREAGRFGTDSALPLAALAFAHGDREAESMLAPAQLRERDAAGVIAAADHIHTSEARQWLERVAREHNAPEVRAQADAALARWREGM